MAIPTDEAIVDEIVCEGSAVPAVSYLQRRYELPYLRAARLREKIAALQSVRATGDEIRPSAPGASVE